MIIMGEVFKPGQSKREKIEKLSKELQISEKEAKKILEKRKLSDDLDKRDLEDILK